MLKDLNYWLTQIEKKTVSVPEIITQIEAKIARENLQLNALLTFDTQAALDYYQQRPNLTKTPFKGFPLPLKILGQSKQGWLDTSSSRLFLEHRASQTNAFVTKLETLGFTPFGQTNAPEFGFKNITDPHVYGVTKNPWNVDHTSGGSSGGAAAVVAAGIFPLAGASDGGGSIRIPASFTGLIGLKPTRGSMPVGPTGWRGWQGASINFALSVSVRDTQFLFEHLRGTAKAAPYHAPAATTTPNKKRLRIAYSAKSPIGTAVSSAAKAALTKSLRLLEQLGHELVEVPWPVDGVRLMQSYYAMNGGETAAMFGTIEKNLQRAVTPADMELMTWAIYQYGKKISAASYIDSLQYWDEAAYQMEQLFESFDLFLTPTTAETAPTLTQLDLSATLKKKLRQISDLSETAAADLIYEMFLPSLSVTPFTQLANLTGQPAISLPLFLAANGLPLGIQLMASKGKDETLLEFAKQLEDQQAFILPPEYTY